MSADCRLAIISDVHGNAFALDAVLAVIRREGPDRVINLGDQVFGSADPARAYEMQCELGALEVRGNNEEKLAPGWTGNPGSMELRNWLLGQLPSGAVERLTGLPLSAHAVGGALLAVHGTPRSAWEDLLWSWNGHGQPWRHRLPDEVRGLLAGARAEVIVCGHTHQGGQLELERQLVVNCGAVGLQIDGDPRARWTLLERLRGKWKVTFRREVYDWDAAAKWVRRNAASVPDQHEFAEFLVNGRY